MDFYDKVKEEVKKKMEYTNKLKQILNKCTKLDIKFIDIDKNYKYFQIELDPYGSTKFFKFKFDEIVSMLEDDERQTAKYIENEIIEIWISHLYKQ